MDKKLLDEILFSATSEGAEFAEVFYENKDISAVAIENGKIEDVYQMNDIGVGIRVINGEQVSYAYTNDLSLENLSELAHKAGEAVKGKAQEVILPSDKAVAPKLENVEHFTVENQIQMLKEADQLLREQAHLKQASLGCTDSKQEVIIANTRGLYVEEERYRRRANCRVVLENEGNLQTGYSSIGVTGNTPLFDEENFNGLSLNAYKHGNTLLEAKPCQGGKLPVIMASSAGGTMVHEACGHGLEGDLVERGVSAYKGKLGEQVAVPEITVIDNGAAEGRYGSSYFDDEGHKTQETRLIEDGILQQYMCDFHTSQKTGWQQTGNGRRESYRYRPQTRMTTTLIQAGTEEPEAIIKGVKEGLLVTKMGGGQVNPLNGDYVFDVSEGYWIKDGEVVHAVRGATLAGNGPESLNNVSAIGKDLGYAIGVCGKGGQGAPVADAQPTMRMENLVIGGVMSETEIISE